MSAAAYDMAAVRTATKRFNWTYNLFADLSLPVTWLIANYSSLSANALTLLGGAAGLAGSVLLWAGQPAWAALLFAVFVLLDCSDGAIARLRGQVSAHGAALDLAVDRAVLLVAVLTRSAMALQGGEQLAAWLCAAYLALHYVTDLDWLMRLEREAGLPRQWPALRAELQARVPGAAARVGKLRRFAGFARRLVPSAWECNIVFLLAPCLFPGKLTAATLTATGLLAFAIAANRAAPLLRRVL